MPLLPAGWNWVFRYISKMMCLIAKYFVLLNSSLHECFMWEQRHGFLPWKMPSGSGTWRICAPVCERRIICVPVPACPREFGHPLGLCWCWGALQLSLPLPAALCPGALCSIFSLVPTGSQKVSGASHPNLPKLRVKKEFSGLGVGHLKGAMGQWLPKTPEQGGCS